MGSVIDVIALILFVFVLIVAIGGFNRQMVEKNKERMQIAKDREEKLKSKDDEKND